MNNTGEKTSKIVWNRPTVLAVSAIAVLALITVIMTIALLLPGKTETVNTTVYTQDPAYVYTASPEPFLGILSCPEQVTSDYPTFSAEGIIVSDTSTCSLSINGENIASTGGPGNQVKWSKSFQLTPGEWKTLVFEARDANGRVKSDTRYVYCQPLNVIVKEPPKQLAPITPGCALVKKKPGGLNIRYLPGTHYRVVAYIGDNDYSSEMTFTGNYTIGYDNYTWYEVIAPNGMHGYVRSDLVRTNRYID